MRRFGDLGLIEPERYTPGLKFMGDPRSYILSFTPQKFATRDIHTGVIKMLTPV